MCRLRSQILTEFSPFCSENLVVIWSKLSLLPKICCYYEAFWFHCFQWGLHVFVSVVFYLFIYLLTYLFIYLYQNQKGPSK